MGRMERTIFYFAMVATILILVLVNVARVPASGETSSAVSPVDTYSSRN
jgi:hypothetical protein